LPLLLVAGGAALLLGGKKKKKKASSSSGGGGYDDLPGYDDAAGGDDGIGDYVPPTPPPQPSTPSKPAGNPPRGDSYDDAFWGPDPDSQMIKIREFFKYLGYPVDVTPHPMNILGPKGAIERENYDGTTGKLGGNDDEPSATVRQFQKNYNQVSRLNKAEKLFPSSMGGLSTDGMVGPYTLNGLRYAVEELKAGKAGGRNWQDLIQMAELKGIQS